MHQHRPRIPARHRPGLDPRRHRPARALPVAPGAGPVIAISSGALAGAGAIAAAGVLLAFAAGGPGGLSG